MTKYRRGMLREEHPAARRGVRERVRERFGARVLVLFVLAPLVSISLVSLLHVLAPRVLTPLVLIPHAPDRAAAKKASRPL